MEDGFRFADDLGPEKIIHVHHPAVGLRAVVVVDNTAAGPSIGGARMAPDVSSEECFRLARAMTLKNAAAGLRHGGGKSVIFGDPHMDAGEKERLVRAFARAIGDVSDYIVGPDMGTDERCMAWVRDEIGRSVGLPVELGGIPLDEIGATGYGLAVATAVAPDFCDFSLAGARVVVQGFGSVGFHAARFLGERGAVLIAAADSQGAIYDPAGLDLDALGEIKRRGGHLTEHAKGRKLARDAVIDVECDIWVPAARPDVIHAGNVDRLHTRVMPQGANIPVTEEAERILHERGVVVLPDFVANAGGVICAAVEYAGGTEADAFQAIREKIGRNVREVLEVSRARGVSTREAARELALRRVRAAMSYRRWR